jgi:hypothetical protein
MRWSDRLREARDRGLWTGRPAAIGAVTEPERAALDALALQVAQLRDEVHQMAKELDALLVWERPCQICGRGLQRASLSELTRCDCGWVWE